MNKQHFFTGHSLARTVGMLSLPVILLWSLYCGTPKATESPAYKNPNVPVEQRVEDLLSRMTLEEKIEQLSGNGFDTPENKRLGIPALRMNDGPVGVRWGKATAFPAAVGLAATWDKELIKDVASVIARETRAKGRNYLLGPCVNIHRFPLGGRNFESYGEDPFLAGQMASAFVKGIQKEGVLASVKHFACNNQEWERHNLDVTLDERALREIYLPAFKEAVKEGDAYTVMAAYNILRGEHCSQSHHLLNDILKQEWGFKGFVVSDWDSVYSTIDAANAGLDLEMPHGKFFGQKLLSAVKQGKVKESIIDDKIRRLMRVRFKAGLFDRQDEENPEVLHLDSSKKLALRAAEESLVLLKNKGNILPLNPSKLKKIAVIGPNALDARVGGGGSSKVTPFYAVSPMEGLKKALGTQVQIDYALGIAIRGDIGPLRSTYTRTPQASGTNSDTHGFQAEYYAGTELKGEPVLVQVDDKIDFNWGYDAPHPALHRVDDRNTFSVRWQCKLLPPKSGRYKLNVLHNDGLRLYLDKKLLLDHWEQSRTVFHTASVDLKAGETYDLRLEYFFDGGISMIKMGWELPNHDYIAEAAALAKQADVALVFAGLYERFESESRDRRRLDLPNQNALIEAVAKANPNTVVIMYTGTPVLMQPWLEQIAGLVQAWYPGQEGGNAVANVLFGKVNPSAKLAFSFIKAKNQSPAFRDYGDKSLKSPYAESIFVGYRYLEKEGLEPLFPFGFGLSYTQFQYSDLTISPTSEQYTFDVSLNIKNTGNRRGAEIVQLYVKDPECSVPRPEKELKGFAKVTLEPGETKQVTISLKRDSFAFFHPETHQWTVEPGDYDILIGSSSREIRLKKTIQIQ